ncbi:MalM family protein [Marinobacter sp.]|uniref:MalM family protein n=1 Tax=Marinobacter sp. TaxID=50741 RepID=UPI003A955BC0
MTKGAFPKFALYLLLATLLTGCQVGGAVVSKREGYFTWVDEQGRVRYSPIVGATGKSMGKSVGNNSDKRTGEAVAGSPLGSQEPGSDESAGLEEETEYTLENYPDAEQLEKDGYVRPGQRQPYFTWRDAQGNVRVSYYQPDTRTDRQKGLVEPPIQITEAQVYHAGDSQASPEPVPGHDPDAFAILGIEPVADDFLARFSANCCESLDIQNPESWQSGREFGVTLSEGSNVHSFLTGASPYQLVLLPAPEKVDSLVIRLRSYAQNGVFVPSVVFLDEQMEPVRLVMDLVMDFEPENWHRRGYLEAWIPAFPSRGERWMVLFTREKDLEGQTVIETRFGPRRIPHIRRGELGLMQVEG